VYSATGKYSTSFYIGSIGILVVVLLMIYPIMHSRHHRHSGLDSKTLHDQCVHSDISNLGDSLINGHMSQSGEKEIVEDI